MTPLDTQGCFCISGIQNMEAVIFVGLQAAGKSSFFVERFFQTHVRINMDMLRTRHRERTLTQACLFDGMSDQVWLNG